MLTGGAQPALLACVLGSRVRFVALAPVAPAAQKNGVSTLVSHSIPTALADDDWTWLRDRSRGIVVDVTVASPVVGAVQRYYLSAVCH